MSPVPGRRDPATRRLAAGLALTLGALVAVELATWTHAWFEPVNVGLARATQWLLGQLDIPVARRGADLIHPDGFGYRITYVCSGLRPMAVVAVTVLLAPAAPSWRLAGLALGIAGVAALNLLRLVHLYWIGVVEPDAFDTAHRVTWNVIAVAAVAGFLLWWLRCGRRGRASVEGEATSAHALSSPS